MEQLKKLFTKDNLIGKFLKSIYRSVTLKYLDYLKEVSLIESGNPLKSDSYRITANFKALVYSKAILEITLECQNEKLNKINKK